MKSAYELALERLEARGIERPRDEAFSDQAKAEMAEARQKAEAKLAELEILHRDRLGKLGDPVARATEEDQYRSERRRVEEALERRIAELRGDTG